MQICVKAYRLGSCSDDAERKVALWAHWGRHFLEGFERPDLETVKSLVVCARLQSKGPGIYRLRKWKPGVPCMWGAPFHQQFAVMLFQANGIEAFELPEAHA